MIGVFTLLFVSSLGSALDDGPVDKDAKQDPVEVMVSWPNLVHLLIIAKIFLRSSLPCSNLTSVDER